MSAQINQDNGRSEVKEGIEGVVDWFKGLFGSNNDKSTSFDNFLFSFDQGGGIAKLLIFILVFLVIYSLGEFLPFTERADGKTSWIFIGICSVVSILSTLYLEKREISSLINNYKVVGYLITLIVPLIVVTSISKKLAKEHEFMAKYIWLGFIIVFLYLNFDKFFSGGNVLIYLSVLAYAFAMFFVQKIVWEAVEKIKLKYDALNEAHIAVQGQYASLDARNKQAEANIAGIQNDLVKANTSLNEVLMNSTMDSRTKDGVIATLNAKIEALLLAEAASAKVIAKSNALLEKANRRAKQQNNNRN